MVNQKFLAIDEVTGQISYWNGTAWITPDIIKLGEIVTPAPVVGSVMYGNGLLAANNITGTVTGDIDASGGFDRITAASGANALAQIITPQLVSYRNNNTYWRMSLAIDNISDVIFKAGLSNSATPPTGNTCLNTGQNGAVFRFIAGTDTNFQIVHADTVQAETVEDTGLVVAAATPYIFELYLNSTDLDWAIYNISGTVLASGSTGSNIPAGTHRQFRFVRTENILSTAKSWYFRSDLIYRTK